MGKPRVKIERDSLDKFIEITGGVALLILLGLPIFYYNALPETIPIHYSLNGKPDGFSGKGIIWRLSAIGLMLHIGLSILNRYPHIFNYTKEITAENAEQQYRLATKTIRLLNFIIVSVSAYMTYATIQTALGCQHGLGSYFTPIFMALLFGTIGYYLYKSVKEE